MSKATAKPPSRKAARAKARRIERTAPRIVKAFSPFDRLLSYQRKWVDDQSQFKIWLASRQIGKSFSCGAEAIRDVFRAEARGTVSDWIIVTPSERQSLETLERYRGWARAGNLAIADYDEERARSSEDLLLAATLTFPGGSKISAVPGLARTVRGFSRNAHLDEYAHFEDPVAIWRAIFPAISNPLRGGEKKLRITSSANGLGNKFAELCQKNFDNKDSEYSCHRTTIHDAVAAGLPVDVEKLRAAYDDPEGWAQEFECQFLDIASILLGYDLIAMNEGIEGTEAMPFDYWAANAAFPIDCGIDFGRSRNLTVGWFAESIGSLKVTKEVLCLRNMPTPDQVDIFRPRLMKCRRVCVDYTGPGVGLGDDLVKMFGEWAPEKHRYGKIELCTFSAPLKVEIFSKLRMQFEAKNWRIPINRDIREDLHSVQRVVTPAGNVTYRAPFSNDSHADRCTALALCNRASTINSGNIRMTLI